MVKDLVNGWDHMETAPDFRIAGYRRILLGTGKTRIPLSTDRPISATSTCHLTADVVTIR